MEIPGWAILELCSRSGRSQGFAQVAQIFLRRFGIKSRRSGVTEKCVQNLQKNQRHGLAWVGTLFQLRFFEQTAPLTNRHQYSRRAREHPFWHLWAQRHA